MTEAALKVLCDFELRYYVSVLCNGNGNGNETVLAHGVCQSGMINNTYALPFDLAQSFPHEHINFYILGYGHIYPLLVLLTIIATILVVVVLAQKSMHSPTNFCLMYMAIGDLFVAIVPLPFFFKYLTLREYQHLNGDNIESLCDMYQYLVDAIPPLFHNAAMWLTVLLAAQRLVYIKFPLSASNWCTVRNVNIATGVIVVASILSAIPKLMEVEATKPLVWSAANISTTCTRCVRHMLPAAIDHPDAFYGTYYWTRVVLFITIPSVLLFVFSLMLVHSLKIAQARRTRLLDERRGSVAGHVQRDQNTTTMLLLIVVIFLVVNLPQGAMLAFVCIRSVIQPANEELSPSEHLYFKLASMVDNLLILLTYPINFAIYCSMSAQFRQAFTALFTFRRRPPDIQFVGASSVRRSSPANVGAQNNSLLTPLITKNNSSIHSREERNGHAWVKTSTADETETFL